VDVGSGGLVAVAIGVSVAVGGGVVVEVAITVEVTVAVCAYAASIRKIDATVTAVMIRRSSEGRRTRSEQ
jgi:hypothetical protein